MNQKWTAGPGNCVGNNARLWLSDRRCCSPLCFLSRRSYNDATICQAERKRVIRLLVALRDRSEPRRAVGRWDYTTTTTTNIGFFLGQGKRTRNNRGETRDLQTRPIPECRADMSRIYVRLLSFFSVGLPLTNYTLSRRLPSERRLYDTK